MMFGPVFAPLLILPGLSLAGPMFGIAILASILLLWVVFKLPEEAPEHSIVKVDFGHAQPSGGGSLIGRNSKFRPFLLFGFLACACQAAFSQILGFLIIDTMKLSVIAAQPYVALAIFIGAAAGLIAQVGFNTGGPGNLMRWGAGLGLTANALAVIGGGYWLIVASY